MTIAFFMVKKDAAAAAALISSSTPPKSKYMRVPLSLYGLVDDEGDPVDLVPDTATCAMYNMAKITTPKQCLRAAQELGYCGNIEQHFLVRNSTGHVQVGEGPVQTLRESWQSKKQCESCPEYLNQKITGPVLLGEMYEEKGCENGTVSTYFFYIFLQLLYFFFLQSFCCFMQPLCIYRVHCKYLVYFFIYVVCIL